MKRFVTTIAAVGALGFLLVGCGSDASDETTTTALPAETTTTAAEGSYTPGVDAEADAVAEAYNVAFDSTTSFEEKAVYIEDSTGLESTIDTYAGTGETVGGVTVDVTAVTVNGDTADVVYTLQFAGNPTYPGQTGTAMRTDSGWVLSRDMFCGVMASARSACP